MKMAKKFLAVALAGVLALSVLTGCGASVKSKDVADALTKMDVKVEQDKDLDETAKNTLDAIETIIKADKSKKITLDNAVEENKGTVIKKNTITDDAVKKALGVFTGAGATDPQKANEKNQVRVALVKTEDATKDASLQAYFVKNGLVTASAASVTSGANKKVVEPGKLGTAKTSDGKYMLVVIVNNVETVQSGS